MLKIRDPECTTRRRGRAAPAVGIVLAVLMVLESAAGAYATADSNAATEPLRVYLDTILRPALEGKVPSDHVLRAFYATHLATETRAQVDFGQFTSFWKHLAAGGTRLGYGRAVSYVIGEPGDARIQDEVSVEVAVTKDYKPGVLILFIAAAWDAGVALGGGGAYGPYFFPEGSRERLTIAYRLARESVGWRLVLPDQEIAAIERYPAGTPTRRYALDNTVSAHEVTLHMREAIVSKDGTALLFSIENTGDADAQVLTALSLAALTTEDGRTRNVRLLRSAFPDVIPAGMSGSATLVFDPIPDDAGELQFSLGGVRVAGDQFDLTVGLQLAPVK